MKNVLFCIVCLAATLFGCQKESRDLDYSIVKKIVIKGQMLGFNGQPVFRGIVYSRLSNTQLTRMRFTDPAGRFEIPLDTIEEYIQKRGVNLSGGAPLYTNCDSNIIKCSLDFKFKMPFSLFKQSISNDTLYLNYNLVLTALAQVDFAFEGTSMDSMRFQYPVFACKKGFNADYTLPFHQFTGFGVGADTPIDITLSGIKNGKVVKIIRLKETLKPLEQKTIKVDMGQ
jgi:hypothetical protein